MSTDRLDPALTTRAAIERAPAEVVAAAKGMASATLHEAAGRIGALPSAIKPIDLGFRVCGPAITVHSPPGDNLWIHRALYVAMPGDVLVVSCGGAYEYGYWGEVMGTAARALKLGGLVIDAGVRDVALLRELGFPVFSRGLCIRGTGKDFGARGFINAPILVGDVTVGAGDLVVGDEDGVVVVPRGDAAAAIAAGHARDALEADYCRRLEAGERTLDIYGWS
jgi:4-hydroxy-4-methyl-2-oxoglutarate aldolase